MKAKKALIENPPALRCLAAFTLTELLVVVAITLILAALSLGGIRKMTGRANSAKCVGQMKSIGSSFFLFAADNNGVLPTMYIGGSPPTTDKYWNTFMASYAGLRDGQSIGVTQLRCPAKSMTPGSASMYGANYPTVIALNPGQSGASYLDAGARRLTGTVDSRAFLLADAISAAAYSPLVWPLTKDTDGDGINDSSASMPFNRIDFRHDKKANFFLLNGSIVSITSEQWGKNTNNIWGKPQ